MDGDISCIIDILHDVSVGGTNSDGPNGFRDDTETSAFYWAQLRRFHLKTEIDPSSVRCCNISV
jgi:hypothetical protein